MKEPRQRCRMTEVATYNPALQYPFDHGPGTVTVTKMYDDENRCNVITLRIELDEVSTSIDLKDPEVEFLLDWAGYHKAPSAE